MASDRRDRKADAKELPYAVSRGADKKSAWSSVVRAAQGNFDHLMGMVRSLARAHNSLVDDVDELRDVVEAANLDITAVGGSGTGGGSSTGSSGGGGVTDHGDLDGLADNDHPQYALEVKEGGASEGTLVTAVDFDDSDFNVVVAASEADIALNYGTGAGQPAEGNHTHAVGAGTVAVEEDNASVDTAVTTLDFGHGLDVTSDGADEVNIVVDEAELDADLITADDAGGYFTGTSVEDQLQELGAGTAAGDPIGDATNFGAYINRIRTGDRTFLYTDCMMHGLANPSYDSGYKVLQASGSINTITGEAFHPGIYELGTGGVSSGNARIQAGNEGSAAVVIANGRVVVGAWVRIPTASDGTQTFHVFVGLHNQSNLSVSVGDAIGFMYRHSANSGDWQGFVMNDGSVTTDALDDTGGSIPADDNTWKHLELVVNAAGTSIDFYIDKVLKGTISSGIPNGADDDMSVFVGIQKDAGSTERLLDVDAVYTLIEHSTPR